MDSYLKSCKIKKSLLNTATRNSQQNGLINVHNQAAENHSLPPSMALSLKVAASGSTKVFRTGTNV